MTLRIDRLSLRLPPGLGDRAAGIARRVGQGLADAPGRLHGREALSGGVVRLSPHASDAEIAAAVARAIRAAGERR